MGATSWTSFTALYLPSVWKWEKGNADRRAERNKWGYLKCSCCSLVFIPSSPLRPPQQFLIFTEMNLPWQLSGSEGQGQWQVCSPRSPLRWEFSASRSKAGVVIPRLPVFHSAPGYMYFFLGMADGEILKVQRITQTYSIAELFVYYCYLGAGAASGHPHCVFHFKLPLDMRVWKANGKNSVLCPVSEDCKTPPKCLFCNFSHKSVIVHHNGITANLKWAVAVQIFNNLCFL